MTYNFERCPARYHVGSGKWNEMAAFGVSPREDVIPFSVADMEFEVAPEIREGLKEYIDRRDFVRILTVAPTGMAGEVLVWREGYSGVIGFIQTAKRWRRLGVASYMLALACDRFEQQNLYCAEANIRARFPHMLKLMGRVGFEQSELLMRYPGIDINPGQ